MKIKEDDAARLIEKTLFKIKKFYAQMYDNIQPLLANRIDM